MNNENAIKNKKSLVIKIIIPVLLVCVVAGIWAIKNKKEDGSISDKSGSVGVCDIEVFIFKTTELVSI